MVFFKITGLQRSLHARTLRCIYRSILILLVAVSFIFLGHESFAANTSRTNQVVSCPDDKTYLVNTSRRYQVVAGTDEKAYLVDTSTGAVWILTYRTIATGREPIAIPYKFIKISPKNQHEFLVEDISGTTKPMCGTK
ncbi:MAG: hypothetical protein AB1401_14890 [Thermodesulfobacteriota bacterium]